MIIIKDTREKENFGWDFPCEVKVRKLDTGDYTLEGLESYIIIERKCTPTEIGMNLGVDIKRFERELVRLKDFTLAYLVCEFSLSSLLAFPKGCRIPASKLSKIKLTGKFLVSELSSLCKKYEIELIYTNGREDAISKVWDIFQLIQELKE
jgi:hypothetical protein